MSTCLPILFAHKGCEPSDLEPSYEHPLFFLARWTSHSLSLMNWQKPKFDTHQVVTQHWIEVIKQLCLLKPSNLRAMDQGVRLIERNGRFRHK